MDDSALYDRCGCGRLSISGGRPQGRNRGGHEMKESANYVKMFEWSNEDGCFVGSCPGLLYGGCPGQDEVAVLEQLCAAVGEAIEFYQRDGKPLPPPTSGRDYATKMLSVAKSHTRPSSFLAVVETHASNVDRWVEAPNFRKTAEVSAKGSAPQPKR